MAHRKAPILRCLLQPGVVKVFQTIKLVFLNPDKDASPLDRHFTLKLWPTPDWFIL